MKKFATTLTLISFSAIPAFAAQTGGRFVPPPGADLTRWSLPLQVDCNVSPASVSVQGGLGNQVLILGEIFKSPPLNTASFDLLSKNKDSDRNPMLRIQANNEIQIRTDESAEWLAIGQFSDKDVADYCSGLKNWESLPTPRPELPVSSRFTIALYPGVRAEIFRRAQWSLCIPNILSGDSHRNLDYTAKVTDTNGISETFEFTDVMSFSSSSACKNWSEAPWVNSN